MPSTDTHSTVSSTVTTTCGLAAMLRALRELGLPENMNRFEPSSQTPQTGSECGRPEPDTVTTQKLRLASRRSAAHDQGIGDQSSPPTP